MDPEWILRLANRGLIVFDLVLGTSTIAAPAATLRALGHAEPTPDAEHLFRRCGPIWLTFAAAHLLADRRGDPADWWAVAWLRGTEIATDALWSASPAIGRPRARASLRLAGAFNLSVALGFAWLARQEAAKRRQGRFRGLASSWG